MTTERRWLDGLVGLTLLVWGASAVTAVLPVAAIRQRTIADSLNAVGWHLGDRAWLVALYAVLQLVVGAILTWYAFRPHTPIWAWRGVAFTAAALVGLEVAWRWLLVLSTPPPYGLPTGGTVLLVVYTLRLATPRWSPGGT